MDRRELINDMKTYVGGSFFTRQKLSEYMGIQNPKNVDKYLQGLERVNGKFYFVNDIATVLKDRCVI